MDLRCTPTPRDTIRDVAFELAENAARQVVQSAILTRDVQVDADLFTAWVALELGTRTPKQLLCDIIDSDALTDAAAKDILATLLTDVPTVRVKLAAAACEYAACDVVHDAERIRESMEPTEAELSRSYSYDDPVRAEQSSMARYVNAALRAAGMWS